MIIKRDGSKPETVRVTFSLSGYDEASTVNLVGDFNDWDRYSHPMEREHKGGPWHITLELPRGREFQFRYLINDTLWVNDPRADRFVPNPLGGDNSLLET